MHPTDKAARVAGALYPLMGVPAVFSFGYVTHTLIVPGNVNATANNILASQMLFRLGIVAELMAAVFFLLLVMALYRLLSAVNTNHARLMVGLVLASVAITFVNVLNNIAALTLFRGADYLAVFDRPQRDALAMLFLGLHRQGLAVNNIFWGLWLLPFGLLVMRSRFLPRILGLLLIVNCFAYVAISVTSLLLPAYGNVVFRASMPALLGELWIMLWLLIKGAKVQALEAPAR
jgi:hypothetical protein